MKLLQLANPDYVFIGNSMLDSRISPDHLHTLTGKKSFLLWEGGAQSAVWYLMLKNVVIPSGVKPQAVFVFFRDTFLTEPHFRTDGAYRRDIISFSTDNEPVLNTILKKDATGREQFVERLRDIYPILETNSQQVIAKISGSCIQNLSHIFSGNFEMSQVNTLLDYSHFRRSDADGENAPAESTLNYNFSAALPVSFLPHMIKLAKENHVPLIFIRVERRPVHAMAQVQSAELNSYIHELRTYLNQEKIGFHDFTGDPRITLDMYSSGDHIDENNKKLYTEIFAATLRDMLQ